MTQKIAVPIWTNLSPEEKEIVRNGIKSILLSRNYSVALLQLLSNRQANSELVEQFKDTSNLEEDFEIIELSAQEEASNSLVNRSSEIVDFCEFACRTALPNGTPKEIQQCIKSCKQSGSVAVPR